MSAAPQGAAGPCLFLGRPPDDSEGNAKEAGGDNAWQRSLTAAARLLHLHTGRSPPTEIPLYGDPAFPGGISIKPDAHSQQLFRRRSLGRGHFWPAIGGHGGMRLPAPDPGVTIFSIENPIQDTGVSPRAESWATGGTPFCRQVAAHQSFACRA